MNTAMKEQQAIKRDKLRDQAMRRQAIRNMRHTLSEASIDRIAKVLEFTGKEYQSGDFVFRNGDLKLIFNYWSAGYEIVVLDISTCGMYQGPTEDAELTKKANQLAQQI